MKMKQLTFILLLLAALTGCTEVVSAEESSAVSTTSNLAPILPDNMKELNSFPIFEHQKSGRAVNKLSEEKATHVVFMEKSFITYYRDETSVLAIGLAEMEGQLYLAIVDRNLKGQFSKEGIREVWAAGKDYQNNPLPPYERLSTGNYKAVTKAIMDQRRFLSQGRGVVIIKIYNSEKIEKTE